MNFMVSAAALVAASHCVSTEETRYYLKGVAVQPHPVKGVILIATDGHRMMVVHDPEGRTPRASILSMNWKSKALKTPAKETGKRCVAMDLGEKPKTIIAEIRSHVTVQANDAYDDGMIADGIAVVEIDGTFPDWTRVVPFKAFDREKLPEIALAFNPSYLATFEKAFKEINGSDTSSILDLSTTATGDPMLISHRSVPNAFGILMPGRADHPMPYGFMDHWKSKDQKQKAA